jgi:ricin-type beta-trefoil lectin protein
MRGARRLGRAVAVVARRGSRVVVAKRSAAVAVALAVVLGSGAAGGFIASAAGTDGGGATYDSSASEPDTWIPGQTQIPVLKHLIKGTTFLDWSRPGLVQTVSVQNNTAKKSNGTAATGTNLYVLQRTRLGFLIADIAAVVTGQMANMATPGGSVLDNLKNSAMGEAIVRAGLTAAGFQTALVKEKLLPDSTKANSAINSIAAWDTTIVSKIRGLASKSYTAAEKANGQVAKDVLTLIKDSSASLNGDAQTLIDHTVDIMGRYLTSDPQTALDDNSAFDQALFAGIKERGLLITPGQTVEVKSTDYSKNLVTWGVLTVASIPSYGANPFANTLNTLLGAVNVCGVSGWAGQLGFPTVEMYIIREDKHGVRMTTAPNMSWIAYKDKVTPATTSPSGSLSTLQGIGYYKWRDMTKKDLVDIQTLRGRAYNALESNGFDAAAATKIITGVLTGLNNGGGGTASTQKNAARLVLQPNFRKLVWLEYYSIGTSGSGSSDALTLAGDAARQAVADAIAKADSKWAADPVPSLEKAASEGLSKGSGKGGFSVWSQETSNMYDACVSATWYGVNFGHALKLLRRIGNDFSFDTGDVWTNSAPDTAAHIAGEYVQIVAAMIARTGNVDHALAKIDDLAITFGGNPGQVKMPGSDLLEWWDQNGGFPASKPVAADNVPHKIKLGSHRNYCLTFPNGKWSDGADIIVSDWYCQHFNDNTAERWTFTPNRQLQADNGDGKTYCVTAGASGPVSDPSVHLKECKADTPGQKWRRYADQTIHLYSDASPSRDTKYCLASPTADPTGAPPVLTAKCNAADPAQVWTFDFYSNTPTITFNSLSATTSRQSIGVNITYTCTADVAKIKAYANDYNKWVYGNGQIKPTCDGAPHTATITVTSQNGLYFASGPGYAWAVMQDANGQQLTQTPENEMAFP